MSKNILLDYFFNVEAITPTSQASTAFLKQACIVVNSNSGGTDGDITQCSTIAEIEAVTDNEDAKELLAGGMSKIYVLQNDDLDLQSILDAFGPEFFTLIISSDFNDTNITGMDLGLFKGVVGVSSATESFLEAQAVIPKRVSFFTKTENGAKNMCYAFGKLLSSFTWRNQQYVTMPYDDEVETLGKAESYFDDKISFVLNDKEFGKRLGLFAVGGKAIVAPYILKNLEIDMQSRALSYISGNQPQYTIKEATLIEDELSQVIQGFVDRGLITIGTVSIAVDQGNFIASGQINVSEPTGLWRFKAELKQTL